MKEVDQNILVDTPHFGVLFSQLQQQPADAGEGSCHFQQCADNPNKVSTVIVHDQGEHNQRNNMVQHKGKVKLPKRDVGQNQAGAFKNEKTQVDVAQEMRGDIVFSDDVNVEIIIQQEIPQPENDGPETKQTPHHRCRPKYLLTWT